MFYNLRKTSLIAYVVIHKRGLVGLAPVAGWEEVESVSLLNDALQNVAEWDSGMNLQPGSSDHHRDEPDWWSESKVELLRTVEELHKQVCKENKSAMQAEKECLTAWAGDECTDHKTHPNRDWWWRSRLVCHAGGWVSIGNRVMDVRGGVGIRARNSGKSAQKSPPWQKVKNKHTLNASRTLTEVPRRSRRYKSCTWWYYKPKTLSKCVGRWNWVPGETGFHPEKQLQTQVICKHG